MCIRDRLLPIPEALFTEIPKVMSTADPLKKMSASMGEKHNIDVFASPDQIRKQIKSAVTDTGTEEPGKMSAGVENLFSLLKAAGNTIAHAELMDAYSKQELKYATLKEVVAESLVSISNPMREKMAEIQADKKAVKSMIKASSSEIRKKAKQNLDEIKDALGLMNVG